MPYPIDMASVLSSTRREKATGFFMYHREAQSRFAKLSVPMYPRVWDTNSFDPVTTEGFMPEMGVLP